MSTLRGRLLAVVATLAMTAGLVATVGAAPASAATTLKVGDPISVKCAFFTYSTPTDWYFPATGTPKGLVWLQHGFTESNNDYTDLGPKLAAAGYVAFATTLPTADMFGCTVENVGNNTGYLNNIAGLFTSAASGSGALVSTYNDAARKVGRTGLGFPQRWAFVGHSAGGEAVTYIAQRIRSTSSAAFAKLGGLVLADPVASFIGTNLADALGALNSTSLPIYALASPPYTCNNNQSGTLLVEQKLTTRTFHGSLIVSGAHGDVFGSASNGAENLACGTPQAKNIAAVQGLTTAWLGDELAGTHTATSYPGGSAYQALVGAGTIATLP